MNGPAQMAPKDRNVLGARMRCLVGQWQGQAEELTIYGKAH